MGMESKRVVVGIAALAIAAAGSGVLWYTLDRFYLRKKRKRESLLRELESKLCYGRPGVDVRVISDLDQLAEANKAVGDHRRILGFDIEWVEGNKVSLIQLAFPEDGLCLLLRHSEISGEIRDLLESDKVLKFGVGIAEDVRKIKTDLNITVQSFVDIRHLVDPDIKKKGLAGLSHYYLNLKIEKSWRIRAGNWEAPELSEIQVEYASNDAFVGLNVVQRLAIDRLTFENYRDFDLIDESYKLALPFKNEIYRNGKQPPSSSCQSSPNNKREKKEHKLPVRKTPLYHNAILEAPDGQQLCNIDPRKAEWYILKDLGRIVNKDPFTVRLKFEPAGRPEGPSGEYYLTFKENVCVVCGREDSYLRKYIVPREYRRHFPNIMRDHQSHDVLLMCINCHQRSNCYDLDLRRTLALECGVPIGIDADVKVKDDMRVKKVISACRALIKSRHLIPQKRIDELEEIVKEYYEVTEITDELLQTGDSLQQTVRNENYVPHGKGVVDYYIREGLGILSLEKRWRRYFLEKMKPKFLPPLWSVDHQEQRLDVKAAENRIDPKDYELAFAGCFPQD